MIWLGYWHINLVKSLFEFRTNVVAIDRWQVDVRFD